MKFLEVRNIEISPSSIKAAIADLDEAIAKHEQMKSLLLELLKASGGKVPGRRGRKPGAAKKTTGKRGRRPRGGKTLRQAILDVLKAAKAPLAPIDLKEKVLKAGYKTKAKPLSLYTAVYNTAKAEAGVGKSDDGFFLKGSPAASAKPKAKKAKTVRKAKKAKTVRKAKKAKTVRKAKKAKTVKRAKKAKK